jgi:hypothetical protein
MDKVKKLDEGQIELSNSIIADISLSISYKQGTDYVEISTYNEGGGNYICIKGINDKESDNSIYIINFEDLLIMINHFKESYSKIVTNTKIK